MSREEKLAKLSQKRDKVLNGGGPKELKNNTRKVS
jgi:hypothetical protein